MYSPQYLRKRIKMWVKTSLYTESGSETCFGWDRWDPAPTVKVLASDSKTSPFGRGGGGCYNSRFTVRRAAVFFATISMGGACLHPRACTRASAPSTRHAYTRVLFDQQRSDDNGTQHTTEALPTRSCTRQRRTPHGDSCLRTNSLFVGWGFFHTCATAHTWNGELWRSHAVRQ